MCFHKITEKAPSRNTLIFPPKQPAYRNPHVAYISVEGYFYVTYLLNHSHLSFPIE